MKSIDFPITLAKESNPKASNQISKRTIYFILILAAFAGGFFLPILFVAAVLLLVIYTINYCYDLYKEISNLDFGSDNYSITLGEIIEDLEG